MVNKRRIGSWLLLFIYIALFLTCTFAAIVNFGGGQAWIGWILSGGISGIFAALAAIKAWRPGPVIDAWASIILFLSSVGIIVGDLVIQFMYFRTKGEWSLVAALVVALVIVCLLFWREVHDSIGVLRTRRNLRALFPGHDDGNDPSDSHAYGSDGSDPTLGAGDVHRTEKKPESGIG